MLHIYKILLPPNSTQEKSKNVIEIIDLGEDNIIEDIEFVDETSNELELETDYHNEKYGFSLPNIEIRSFLTHRKVWKQFLESNWNWTVIIEDNVDLKASYLSILDTMREIPDDCDIFFPYDIEGLKYNKDFEEKELLNPNMREIQEWKPYLLGFKMGYSFYFINKKGAKKLLSINKIRQRLDDEILSLMFEDKLNCYTEIVGWFNRNQLNDFDFLERKKQIWREIKNNTSWTDLNRSKVQELLKIISNVARDEAIDIILQGGTHLGYIRHKEIMAWDDDIDIGIKEDSVALFFEKLKQHEGNGIQWGIFIEKHTEAKYYKIWKTDGEPIDKYPYTFPFVDLWVYNIVGDDLVFKNGIICPNSGVKPFIEISFEKSLFKIPHNSLEILDGRYKDWRNKIRVYRWSHRLEKPFFSPLNIDIETDEITGQMIGLR